MTDIPALDYAKLVTELVRDEGSRRFAYVDCCSMQWFNCRCRPDKRGKLTIGVGWNLDDNGIPEETIDSLLLIAVERAVEDLDAIEPRWREFDRDRQRVLVNLAFNLGRSRLSGFRDFWQSNADYLDGGETDALRRGKAALLDSKWRHQVGPRAIRLADRWGPTE